jgi:hypothetical protein
MPNYNLGPIVPPITDAGVELTTCAGNPVQLQSKAYRTTASGDSLCNSCVYDWQPAEYLSGANTANPTATINATTTFTVTVTDMTINASCNKTATDTVTVYVTDNAPAIQNLYVVPAGEEYFLLPDLQPNTGLEIASVSGQIVYTTENYQNDLALQQLAAGMYYYRINLPDCYELEGKLVVVR